MSDDTASLCEHVRPGTWPWHTELVLDDHLGITDALVRCRECARCYLLEMLDWDAGGDIAVRLMRVRAVPAGHAEQLIHDIGRGSCDVDRAGAQVHHASTQAPVLPWLVLLDGARSTVLAVVPAPPGERLPGAGWRELPCDGGWIDYARSKTEMVNG